MISWRKTMYKVTFYAQDSTSYGAVLFKWFKTAEEAFEYSKKLGDRVIETKHYEDGPQVPKGYPPAELDFS